MVDVMRFRHADPKRIEMYPVDSANVIEIGDQVFLAVDDVRAASAFTFVATDLPRTQANFKRDFVGIAMDASDNGDTADIAVARAGTFEMVCAAAQFEEGDFLGPDDNAGNTALVDDQVIALGENGYGAIMRVARRYSANTTRVMAEIMPTLGLAQTPLIIPIYSGLVTAAEDLVTDWLVEWPFKLVAVISVVTIDTTVGAAVITIRNGATALDDTHSISVGTKGLYERTLMDDATGDDRFDAGALLDVASDGGATAGEAAIFLEVKPYLLEQ